MGEGKAAGAADLDCSPLAIWLPPSARDTCLLLPPPKPHPPSGSQPHCPLWSAQHRPDWKTLVWVWGPSLVIFASSQSGTETTVLSLNFTPSLL